MSTPKSYLIVMKSFITHPILDKDMRSAERGPATLRQEQAALQKAVDQARRSSGNPIDHEKAPVWASHTSLDQRMMGETAVRQQGSESRIADVVRDRSLERARTVLKRLRRMERRSWSEVPVMEPKKP